MSTHSFGVSQSLQLARALGYLPQSVKFYGLEIDKTLSEAVQKHLYKLIEHIMKEIDL